MRYRFSLIVILLFIINIFASENIIIENNEISCSLEASVYISKKITSEDAIIILKENKKFYALERFAEYLDSHKGELHTQFSKDNILNYTGRSLKVEILNSSINHHNDGSLIDLKLNFRLNLDHLIKRINEVEYNYDLKKRSIGERQRSENIYWNTTRFMNNPIDLTDNEIIKIVNQIKSNDWFYKGYDSKDNKLKIEHYSKAIDLDPKNLDAYNNRGLVYQDLGNYDLSINDFKKIIVIDPQAEFAYANRGNSYRLMSKYDEALKDYNCAIKIDSIDSKLYANRGSIFDKLGKYKNAIEQCKNLINKQFEIVDYIIFGSFVRAKEDNESDLDLLILTEKKISRPKRHIITDIVFEINLKYNTNISTLVIDEYSWQNGLISILPIKREIMNAREEVIELCFSKAHHELSVLKGKNYEKIVKNLIMDGLKKLGGKGSIITSRAADKTIAKELGLSVVGRVEKTGGVIIKSTNGKVTLDYTFDGILEREKGKIRRKVGKILFT